MKYYKLTEILERFGYYDPVYHPDNTVTVYDSIDSEETILTLAQVEAMVIEDKKEVSIKLSSYINELENRNNRYEH